MQIHKSCPECHAQILADSTSCRCGWSANPRAANAKDAERCAWNDHGDYCGHRGILSASTTGSGPWYCRQHFSELQGMPTQVQGNQVPRNPKSHALREWREAMDKHKAKFEVVPEKKPNPLESAA